MRCPCVRCKLRSNWKLAEEVQLHLLDQGFMKDYGVWTGHGEVGQNVGSSVMYYGSSSRGVHRQEHQPFEQMVLDAAGPGVFPNEMDVDVDEDERVPEAPNQETQAFYKMLADGNTPLWGPTEESCQTFTKLSAALYLLSIKSDWNMPQGCFEAVAKMMSDGMPKGNHVPRSLYAAKKEFQQLGLECIEIVCYPRMCMLYYKDDVDLDRCKFCPQERYKITIKKGVTTRKALKKMWYFPLTLRLKRLFASKTTQDG